MRIAKPSTIFALAHSLAMQRSMFSKLPQYTALQKLHDTYQDRGFEILDFPCNQFMNQAPENDSSINEFCTLTYHTKFLVDRKGNVVARYSPAYLP